MGMPFLNLGLPWASWPNLTQCYLVLAPHTWEQACMLVQIDIHSDKDLVNADYTVSSTDY